MVVSIYDKVLEEILKQAMEMSEEDFKVELEFLKTGPIVEMFVNENMELLNK